MFITTIVLGLCYTASALVSAIYSCIAFWRSNSPKIDPDFWKISVFTQILIYLAGISYYEVCISYGWIRGLIAGFLTLGALILLGLGLWCDWRWALYVSLGCFGSLILLLLQSIYISKSYQKLLISNSLVSIIVTIFLFVCATGMIGYFTSNTTRGLSGLLGSLISAIQIIILDPNQYRQCNLIPLSEWVMLFAAGLSWLAGVLYMIIFYNASNESDSSQSSWQRTVSTFGSIVIIINLLIIGYNISHIELFVRPKFPIELLQMTVISILSMFFALMLYLGVMRNWSIDIYYLFAALAVLPLLVVPRILVKDDKYTLVWALLASGLVIAGLCLLYQNDAWQNWLGLSLGLAGFILIILVLYCISKSDSNLIQDARASLTATIYDRLKINKNWNRFLTMLSLLNGISNCFYYAGLLSKAKILNSDSIKSLITVSKILSLLGNVPYLISGIPIALWTARWWILCILFILIVALTIGYLLYVWLKWSLDVDHYAIILTLASITLSIMFPGIICSQMPQL